MRWVWRGVLAFVLLLAGGALWLYWVGIGQPFSFNAMLNTQAIGQLLDQPQTLSSVGVLDGTILDFHSGRLDDYGLGARQREYDRTRADEAEVRAWDKSKLDPQERLSWEIAVWNDERRLADRKYPWLGADGAVYPVNQAFGIQKNLPNFLLSQHRITNAKLARNYVARLRAMARVLDAVDADVARQAKLGVIPPDFIIDDSIVQMQALIAGDPARNVLVQNLAWKSAGLGDLSPAERDALIADAAAAVKDDVYPAYRRLIGRMGAIRPLATHDAGLWHIKGGDAYYADQLRALTSTDMTPQQIHQYGLSEVARITAEMDSRLRALGLIDGTVGARMTALAHDPRFEFHNTDADRARIVARYGALLGHVKTLLPEYFADIPKAALAVARVPPYAQAGSAGAYYEPGSLDGSRPGTFFVNLRNVEETPSWAMPTLAYHEGIPGHHLQIATAAEIRDLPYERRFNFLPAYTEGWALYAEHLAGDMGLYRDDPYGDLGRLQAELFRAVRLVVDTGMHAQRWSREQAIGYMQATTGMANSDVTAEVERYVVWPGQACAYKIGMKTILDLRQQARADLGAKFDIRQFHKVVLENGAMPLWLLQRNVDSWIAAQEGVGGKQADLAAP
ncbi:MAG TPA: DUF885 domain-containing protein [Rhizomicrobium sp.]|nr:DUF885 domain-containing protein [Rhizomicrobium sp.]